jgi:hypothetical protein
MIFYRFNLLAIAVILPISASSSDSEDQDFWTVAENDGDITWHDEELDNEETVFTVLGLQDRDWMETEKMRSAFDMGSSDRTKRRENDRRKVLAKEGRKHSRLLTDYFVRYFECSVFLDLRDHQFPDPNKYQS